MSIKQRAVMLAQYFHENPVTALLLACAAVAVVIMAAIAIDSQVSRRQRKH